MSRNMCFLILPWQRVLLYVADNHKLLQSTVLGWRDVLVSQTSIAKDIKNKKFQSSTRYVVRSIEQIN